MAKSGTFALTGTELEKFQQTNKEAEEPTKTGTSFEKTEVPRYVDPTPKEDDDDRRRRTWAEIRKKCCFEDDSGDAYDDYKVLPGFHFWQCLAKMKQDKLSTLKVRIPDCIVVLPNNSCIGLSTHPTSGHIVKIDEQYANLNEFEAEILKKDPSYLKEPHYSRKYFMCMRQESGFNEMNLSTGNDLLTLNVWKSRSNNEKLKPKHLIQKYIYPTGNKACITRMVYKTKHNKGESQGPALEAPRTPVTDGDTWECRQGVADKNAPPIQYRTVITKGVLRMVRGDVVIWECFNPAQLNRKQLTDIRMIGRSFINDEKETKAAYMPDEYTIRIDYLKKYDFVNTRKHYILRPTGPFNQACLQANYALKIRNDGNLHDDKPNVSKSAITNKTNENSFTYTQITGQPLKDFEEISERVCEFLERSYPVNIFFSFVFFVNGDR
jgi:hypothetical protein